MLNTYFGLWFACNLFMLIYSAPAPEKLQIEWNGPVKNCTGDPNLETCLTKLFVDLKPIVTRRIDELGLRNLNPIKFDSFNYDFNQGPIKLNVLTKDVKLFGVPKFSSLKLNVDTNQRTVNFAYEVPVVKYEANYKVGGNVLFLQVKGGGPVSFELHDVKLQGQLSFVKTNNEDGKNSLKVLKTSIKSGTIGKIKNAHISGLFGGNPLFAAVIQYFAENYGSQLFELVKKDVGKYTEDAMTNLILNPILRKIPNLADLLL